MWTSQRFVRLAFTCTKCRAIVMKLTMSMVMSGQLILHFAGACTHILTPTHTVDGKCMLSPSIKHTHPISYNDTSVPYIQFSIYTLAQHQVVSLTTLALQMVRACPSFQTQAQSICIRHLTTDTSVPRIWAALLAAHKQRLSPDTVIITWQQQPTKWILHASERKSTTLKTVISNMRIELCYTVHTS